MRIDPSERIIFESAPPLRPPAPLWLQVTLGVVVGGVILFSIWFGYQKYQQYRLAKAFEAATLELQRSLQEMTLQTQQAELNHRQRLEVENRAHQQRLEQQRLRIEEERIAQAARLSADTDRALYIQQLSDPKCQFWLNNLRTTGSEKAKVMVDYHCPE